ncbi:hypothetical protein Syun_001279 [Stephania yunnanensis]|uniref:DUF7953 domain-containing protein n=1 Tax=Stephania yunnanensis TaxID=152371 RepID=A0AAP0LHI1_9MAGN
MMIPISSSSRDRVLLFLLLLCSILLNRLPGIYSAGVVTLQSIQIYNTHELFTAKPKVYFRCEGENKTVLPDVKQADYLYAFKGEESWQPLTELPDKKCKRCGFYEEDTITPDDVFDEWEFCPSDFAAPDGKYVRFKEKELNATFLCSQCMQLGGSSHNSDSHNREDKKKGASVFVAILTGLLVLVASFFAAVAAYKYWQKKKRQREQARFLKLFEDVDDIEDELGLGHVI